jgi:hypothetical protein
LRKVGNSHRNHRRWILQHEYSDLALGFAQCVELGLNPANEIEIVQKASWYRKWLRLKVVQPPAYRQTPHKSGRFIRKTKFRDK